MYKDNSTKSFMQFVKINVGIFLYIFIFIRVVLTLLIRKNSKTHFNDNNHLNQINILQFVIKTHFLLNLFLKI